MAVRKEIKNITHIVNEDVSNGKVIWIVIDNTKLQLRLGLIFVPQESRSTTVKLQKMYDKIGRQIEQANVKDQDIIILGDFNCKIGDEIAGNNKEISKGGKMMLDLKKRHRLDIVNSSPKCTGL